MTDIPDEAREAVYMVVAIHDGLTVVRSEHGAKVPGHWAKYVDDLIEAAAPIIRADERRRVAEAIKHEAYQPGKYANERYRYGMMDAAQIAERNGE